MDPDSIVISGMAGRFPGCDNVEELQKALIEGVDLVSEDHGRWTKNFYNLNNRAGIMKDIDHFDMEYFGVTPRQAEGMDPKTRILLELTLEALVDAGLNPLDVKGSRTAVLVGMTTPRGNVEVFDNKINFQRIGRSPAMTSGMISFLFDLRGPSYPVDTACSSSLYAFCQAFRAIKGGECDAAIVCGATLSLDPFDSLEYKTMNILSPTGKCRFLDEARDGFVKSETAVVTVLQKRKDARRIYATVKGCGTNTDGFKIDGVTKPSPEMQTRLFKEVMREFNISPADFTYVEAHGTGTPVGDLQEINAIADSICVGRKEPLLIGSVKTNMGHSEMASGVTSIMKVILTMEHGVIPPIIHLNKIGDEFTAVHEGKLKPVTELTPWREGVIGINSFGIGGTNANVVLKPNTKKKNTNRSKLNYRLLVLSGRNEKGLKNFIDLVKNDPNNLELIMFLNNIFYKPMRFYSNKSFLIFNNGKILEETCQNENDNGKVWFVYSGIGSQWPHMCRDLMKFDVFKKFLEECAEPLRSHNIDLIRLLTEGGAEEFKNVTNCFIAIVAMSVCLTDLLKLLGVQPDGMIGHSVGEIGCAYCDGLITKQQAMLIAHARGVALQNTSSIEGTLAVVGLTEEVLSKTLPADLSIACYNSIDNFTISGPRKSIEKYVNELNSFDKFAEIVKGAEKAFHSDYISDAGDLLVELLKDIIPVNKMSSGKWITSASEHKTKIRMNGAEAIDKTEDSAPKEQKILHCPEYYRKNLVHSVLFSSAMESVPKDALVIEISPKGLLQGIIKRNLGKEAKVLSLSSDTSTDNYEYLLSSIGRLYLAGLYPNILKLYQDKDLFPLTRGTPSLAPLIQWEKTPCKVPYYSPEKAFGESFVVDIREPSTSYLEGHMINDKLVFPVVGYAYIAWEIFAHLLHKPLEDVPIVIENMKIKRATVIQKDSNIVFNGNILSNGDFEILEGGAIVCTGSIKSPGDINKLFSNLSEEHLKSTQLPENCVMDKDDVYYFFKLLGLQYKDNFQGILEAKGSLGKLKWNNIWTAFLDTAIHYTAISSFRKKNYLPESIGMIIIDPQAHLKVASEYNNEIPIKYDEDINIIQCGKVEIRDLTLIEINRRKTVAPKLETHNFIPYKIPERISLLDCINLSVQIVLENSSILSSINILEVPKGEIEDENISKDVENSGEEESSLSRKLEEVISDEVSANVVYDKANKLPTSKQLEKYELIVIHEFEENMFIPLRTNDKGFILLKGNNHISQELLQRYDYVVISTFFTEDCTYWLIRAKQTIPKEAKIINITTKSLDWVNTLKDSMKSMVGNRIYLVSENEETCGIIGLFTCLRFEEGGTSIRAVFVPGKSPEKFSLASKFWREQLEKDLSVNVLRNGMWGSYRFLPYKQVESLETENCYAISTAPGDFSRIKMIDQSPHFRNPKNVVTVYYAGANFKDVLIGSGMLNLPGVNQNTTEIGYEYSGRTSDGQRVFGFTTCHAFATVLETDFPVWKIPDAWTMEEAASVPIIYLTLFYAFRYKTNLKKGKSILVHSASGGVGMAAIQFALNLGCKIFATVGNDSKRKNLLRIFPQLEEKNIFSSRDGHFEISVKQETDGRGVDYVLNSLTGDLFNASLRCVASNGHFVEIGKTEFLTNSKVQAGLFMKSASLHAVSIDQFLVDEPKEIAAELWNFFEKEIPNIRPIPHREVFDIEDIENALKHFQSDSHSGKIILKVRDEEPNKTALPSPRKMVALPKLYFNPNKSYVIIGGLGGLGLELLKLICESGGKHIILNSRNPPGKGFKNFFIRSMRSWDCEITLNHDDTSIFKNAEKLLKEASKKVPLGGIFNLAMVNRDAILENQTVGLFEEVFRPKALITANLDKLTRQHYPDLDQFVVYSSITCGKGNLGQTNYGFANSTMERIIEMRNRDGLPGLVIQWGPMADAGYFARTSEKQDLGYFTAQSMFSYREVLQQILLKSSGVVASYVVRIMQDIQKGDSLFEALLKMFGITNPSKVSDEATLMDLGLDSLMGFEIKQYLLREYEIDISTKDLRNKTIKEIKEIDKNRKNQG